MSTDPNPARVLAAINRANNVPSVPETGLVVGAVFAPPLAVPITDAFFSEDDPRELILGSMEKGGPRFLVRGNRYLLLAGEGGIGKSRLAVRLIVSLALRRDAWMGRIPIHRAGDPLRCLYVQHENSDSRIKRDLMGFLDADADRGSPWTPDDVSALGERVFYTRMNDSLALFALPVNRASGACPGADNLSEAVRTHRPDVVLLDPLADFLGVRNENDNAEVGEALTRLLGAIGRGAADTGIPPPAVVLVHHGKAGRDAHMKAGGSDGKNHARGATAIVNRAGAVINVWPAEGEDADGPETLILSTPKMNDGRRPPEFAVRFDGRDYSLAPDFDIAVHRESLREASAGKPARKRAAAHDAGVSIMRDRKSLGWGELAKAIHEAVGGGRTTAHEAIRKMVSAGEVTVTPVANRKLLHWAGP